MLIAHSTEKEKDMTETMTRRLAPSGDDYAELRDLVERVAAGIDHRDAELFLSAFAPDARLLRLRPGTENEIIADQAPAESFASGPLKMSPEIETMHTICNARFEVDGDQARGEIYVIAFQFAPIGFSPDHLQLSFKPLRPVQAAFLTAG
jgi:hypothetical protein